MSNLHFAHGTFNGTGAALTICCGFSPDWVKVHNLEDTILSTLKWNRHMMRTGDVVEGYYEILDGDTQRVALTKGTGILPYYSKGTKLTAASTVYLVKDNADYRTSTTYGTITTWTLGSAANYTGNFNLEADTTYVGEGSLITVEEDVGHNVIEAGIVGFTSNGEVANEVVLSYAVKTGSVRRLKGMYDYRGGAANVVLPDGFTIQATSIINVSGEMCMFEAGCYPV